jgi:hypothetical protein
MSRTTQTVWKSAGEERELLRLERETGIITVPVHTITVTELRDFHKAVAECAELATTPVVCEPPKS